MNTETLTPHGIALLRISLGVMTLAHGLLKIFVFTIPGTFAYFESLGLPGIAAYAVIAAEVIGGIALIIGFQTRIVALALIPVLIGATITHAGNGWLFSNPNGGWEFPAFWTLALVAQAMLGDGAWRVAIPGLEHKLARA